MTRNLLLWLVPLGLFAQTTPTGPTYFTTTGIRFSYYDQTLTETTNIGVRVTGSGAASTPAGFWTVLSIDATPRSQATSAAARVGAQYYLKSAAGGNLIFHTAAGVGLASVPASVPASSAATSSTSSYQLNIMPGVGATWRACHTFWPSSTLNCVVDMDYDLNWVNTQAVKPVVGLFVGLAF